MESQNMIIPKDFDSHFKAQIESIDVSAKTSQEKTYFKEFYPLSFDLEKNKPQIQNKLAQIGISSEKSINLVLIWLKEMHEFYRKIEVLIQSQKLGNLEDHNKENVTNWKFGLYAVKKYLNNQSFAQILDQTYNLQMNDKKAFFYELNQNIEILEFEKLKEKLTPLLQQQTDYGDKKSEQQMRILRLIYHRNLCFQQIKMSKIENLLQNQTLLISLDIIYGNIQNLNLQTVDPSKVPEQTEQKFKTRVTGLLDLKSSKFQGWNQSKKIQLVSKLFQQVPNYNYEKILNILLQSKLKQFAKKSQITDELLTQIFNLPSADFLNKQSQPKGEEKTGLNDQQKEKVFNKNKPKKEEEQDYVQNKNTIRNKEKEKSPSKIKQQKKSQEDDSKANQSIALTIQRLEREIKLIKAQTKNKQCIEVVLRQLQISILNQNQKEINLKAEQLKNLVTKYKCRTNCLSDLQEIKIQVTSFKDRLPKVSTIRKKLYVINLIDVLEGKNFIQNQRAAMCKDADSILIIGRTGAGKSTLMTALAGYKLIFSSETQDFRAQNPDAAKQIPISNRQQSETRFANVKHLSKIYSNGKTIVVIDTPGFQDNRGIEIEILNNIATVNLIKKLKSARILIVLPQEQFYGARQIQNYTKFIKLFAAYFFNVKDFEYAINIVLTKGLTAKQLLKTIGEIEITQTFKNIDWSNNQKNFQNILKRKLNELKRHFEIVKPSEHSFQLLMQDVMELSQKQSPGDDICESFSPTALQGLQQSYNYLQKMVKQTFDQGQFTLMNFYLNSIKQLDTIQKNKNYYQIKTYLKQKMEDKVKKLHSTFKKFLSSNNDEWLNELKQLKDYFCSPQSQEIYKLLYYDQQTNTSEKNPKQIFEEIVEEKIQLIRAGFEKTKKLDEKQKIEYRSILKMIKLFGFQFQYNQITNKISNSLTKIKKKLEEILDQNQVDETQWENQVGLQINHFKQNEESNCSDIQRYSSIKNIVQKYIQKNNQLDQIFKLKDKAMTQCLDGKLKKICTQYLKKLNVLKKTHFSIKQIVEVKFNQILMEFDSILAFFEEKLNTQVSIKLADFSMWQNWNDNRYQIFAIKAEFSDNQVLQFINLKQQQSMFKLFFNNLTENIESLQKTIVGIPKNAQHIDPDMIHQKLQTIFELLQALQKKNSSSKGQEGEKDRKQQTLRKTLEKSYKKIENIISSIERTCSIELIRNYEINLKLMNSLTIILEFQDFTQKITDQKLIAKLQKIYNDLIAKIESPLNIIHSDEFKTQFSFEKLWNTLHYMKKLDSQTRLLGGKAINFYYTVDFSQNQKIKETVINCLTRIKNDYEHLKPITELSTFGVKSSIKTTSNLLEQKKDHIEKLQFELLEDAIKFIKSYKFIKKINEDFSDDLRDVQDFRRQCLEKLDLKKIVKSRILSIDSQLSKKLTLEYLKQISHEFNFFNKIYQYTKDAQQVQYTDIENKISQKSKNFVNNFDDLHKEACGLYQDVQNKGLGVDYQTLKQLLLHPGRNIDDGQEKIIKLVTKIDKTYQKILQKYYIEQSPNGRVSNNANIFLNIIEFKQICQQINYQNKLKDNLQKSGLQNLFNQVRSGFQFFLSQLQKGKKIDEIEKRKLIQYEKRIALLLEKQYNKFKKDNSIAENFFISFEKRSKQIKQKLINIYTDEKSIQFNDKFNEIYQNVGEVVREKMKRGAMAKNQNEVKQKKNLINQNHEELIRFYKKKIEEAKNMPQQVLQDLMDNLKPLVNQIQQIQELNKKQIEKATQKKTPKDIFVIFLKGDSLNNDVIKKTAVETAKKYIEEEQQSVNFTNLQKLEENLDRNLSLLQDESFKTATSKNSEIQIFFNKYVGTVKTKFNDRTNLYDKEIGQFNQFMKKRKLGQSLKLSQTRLNPSQFKNLEQGVKSYKIVEKHSNKFVQEIDHFNRVVSERIKQGNKELKQSAQKMEIIKRQLIQNKINDPQKIIQHLQQAHSARVLGETFSSVFKENDKLQTKVQLQSISLYDTTLEEIKKQLKRKYDEQNNWNIQKFIDNLMIVCNQKKNEQDQKTLKIIDSFMPVFFDNNQFSAGISKNIQSNNDKQFYEFQKSAQQEIDLFFNPLHECQTQKIMKYYKLVQKLKQNPSSRFSYNLKIDNKVKQKLLDKWKLNINKIVDFIQKPQNLEKYNSFLDNLKKLDLTLAKKIKSLQDKCDTEIKSECSKIQTKINSEKSVITADDPQKDQKLAKLDNQCKANKLSKKNDLTNSLNKDIENLKKEATKNKDVIIKNLLNYLKSQIVEPLIIFQRVKTYLFCERDIKQSVYSTSLFCNQIQEKYRKTIFRHIHSILTNIDSPHAQSLTQLKQFQFLTKQNWRQLVSGSTFGTLTKKIPHLEELLKKQKFFEERFKKYQQIFKELTDTFSKSADFNQTKKKLVEDTKIMAKRIGQTYQQDKSCKHHRWSLFSRIAAIWTIHRSELNDENQVQFIHKPHPGQILAIFLLLQFDNKQIKKEINNTMVQVSTGEGKSVVLGLLSTYLAVVGFKVYEACYSNYLSERDYADFVDFFDLFEVKDKIFYRTFPQLCRMMLQQSPEKPFIGKIEKLLINPSIWGNIGNFLENIFGSVNQDKKILLIDEADAFLDENYLGQSFFPSINLKKKSVENLLDFVWSYRQKLFELTPQIITKSSQFDALCKQLNNKQFRTLMQNQSNAMVRDLGNYKQDSYTLKDGQIYYKTGDSLTNKIHYGYRTVFNYYHEFYVNKRITKDQFQKKVSINLIVASFSYSMLPSYFCSILGVTGTLDCMSTKQKKILTYKFGVKRTFIQPSIYPPNRRILNFYKCSEDKLFPQVANSIESQLKNRRPIVVFFESKNKVYDFYNSPQFSNFKNNATIVTHEVSVQERTFRIQTSTNDCKITLLTVDFSRGTDFKLHVKDSKNHPGLHVICAFIPNSFSDYLQVVGRTGRQGKNGSVNLYFVDYNLTTSQTIKLEEKNAQKMIKDRDNDHWDKKYDQLMNRMKHADQEHEKSTKLYSKGSSADKIFIQMLEFNREYPIVRMISKTVIAIDATASMGPVFQKLIQVIQTSLPEIRKVIEEAKVQASFEIKFVIYRNYNSTAEELLAFSNFESKTQILAQWLKSISVSGGWGNEAIQVCLQYINSLQNVNQYVIISDAKGNTPDQTTYRRQKYHNDSYFNSAGFPFTKVKDELQKLNIKGVKGHAYYLNPASTKEYYDKFVEMSGGVAQQLPLNNKNSSKLFSQFIGSRILQNIQSLLGNNSINLVERYKARFN